MAADGAHGRRARCAEGDREGMHAVVRCREGVVARQSGLGIAATKADHTAIAGRDRVLPSACRHGDRERPAGHGGLASRGDIQVRGRAAEVPEVVGPFLTEGAVCLGLGLVYDQVSNGVNGQDLQPAVGLIAHGERGDRLHNRPIEVIEPVAAKGAVRPDLRLALDSAGSGVDGEQLEPAVGLAADADRRDRPAQIVGPVAAEAPVRLELLLVQDRVGAGIDGEELQPAVRITADANRRDRSAQVIDPVTAKDAIRLELRLVLDHTGLSIDSEQFQPAVGLAADADRRYRPAQIVGPVAAEGTTRGDLPLVQDRVGPGVDGEELQAAVGITADGQRRDWPTQVVQPVISERAVRRQLPFVHGCLARAVDAEEVQAL